jgi:hypothetical protein
MEESESTENSSLAVVSQLQLLDGFRVLTAPARRRAAAAAVGRMLV